MKKITITQTYEIALPTEYENIKPEELLDNINAMYDVNGKDIIKYSMDAVSDYSHTTLTEIDDMEVYMDGNEIGNQGSIIVLDGQSMDSEV